MKNMQIILGQDIGNGYMKGTAQVNGSNTIEIDYQSAVSLALQPVTFKVEPDNTQEVEKIIDDIYNYMDASFNSPLIVNKYNYFFGRRGITEFSETVRQFNVTAMRAGKAQDELSSIVLLGTIAGVALKTYYKENKKLPTDDINVNVNIALALPINEYIEEKDTYPAKLTTCSRHTVHIHNFNVPQNTININIKFDDVTVLAEGSAAQLAIVNSDDAFIQDLLNDAIKNNPELKELTVNDIVQGDNTVGIDIGEGTVNFPVFSEGSFSPKLSYTFTKGYGSVLDNAIEAIKREHGANRHIYKSRKELNNFLAKEVTGTKKLQRQVADLKIAEQREIFSSEIIEELSHVLSEMGSVDVVYVYGGAATVMRNDLYSKLLPIVARCNPLAPILYVGKDYCRVLNRDGLFACALIKSEQTKK